MNFSRPLLCLIRLHIVSVFRHLKLGWMVTDKPNMSTVSTEWKQVPYNMICVSNNVGQAVVCSSVLMASFYHKSWLMIWNSVPGGRVGNRGFIALVLDKSCKRAHNRFNTPCDTYYTLFQRQLIQVWWPNQHCQSTEGGWLVIQSHLTMLQ